MIDPVAVPYNVPEVGRVTLVDPVAVSVIGKAPEVAKASTKVTFFPAVKVKISPQAKVMELVDSDMLSLTVRVFPLLIVNIPVVEVMVSPS